MGVACGYSPGPRFFAPALPFVLLGLGPALARHPRPVVALLAMSVALSTANMLTWPRYAQGVAFDPQLPATLLSHAGASRALGAAVACAAALAALVLAARPHARGTRSR